MREAAFKASAKGKEEINESGHISEEEEEDVSLIYCDHQGSRISA